MNMKTTYGLIGLLVAIGAVFGIALYKLPSGSEETSSLLFPEVKDPASPLDVQDIDRVEIDRERPRQEKIVLQREGKQWRITEPRALPADGNAVANLVRELLGASRVERADKMPSLGAWGLDPPAAVITLKSAEKGRELQAKIGKVTEGGEGVVYVYPGDRTSAAMPVRKSSLEGALRPLSAFRTRDLLADSPEEVEALTLTRSQEPKEPVRLKKVKGRWRLVQPPYGDVDAAALVQHVADLKVETRSDGQPDYVADGVKDLTKYNLGPKAERLTVEVTRDGGKKATLVVGVGKKEKEKDDKKGKDKDQEKDKGKYYAYLDEGGRAHDVVRVAAEHVDPLLAAAKDPKGLRGRDLVRLDQFRQPDAVDVQQAGGGKMEFRRADPFKGSWVLYRGGKEYAVDEQELQKLITLLTQKGQVQEFVDDAKRRKELGLDRKDEDLDAVVTVWADSLEKPDKKGGKPEFKKKVEPVAKLRFGRLSDDFASVERVAGDEKSVVLVPAELREQAIRRAIAYLDRRVPAFNAQAFDPSEDVTRLALTVGKREYEVERDKGKGPWKIVRPEKLKGREASRPVVEEILLALNGLRALRVASEKPDPSRLGEPSVRAVVTVGKGDKPKKFEYVFGRESKDPKGVYAKATGSDALYVVAEKELAPLRKELRDTAVFNFDPDKVQSFTLTRWQKGGKRLSTRTLVRKKDGWAFKGSEDAVNAGAVQKFLSALSNLQAGRFADAANAPSAKAGAFEVELALDGKKSLQLLVGAEAEDKESYYATSAQMKGDTFTVPKAIFEGPRSKADYFAD